ncbi:MAG: type VI secretion system baseplate subunit TssG [Phycisphaerae bacterium]|nr:type VI secretion system baseplate subunit TssG [Phycisphaerae bacterium]
MMMNVHVDDPAIKAAGDGLARRLLSRGWEFDFFRAVWLLERHLGEGVAVGDRGPVDREWIRFRPHVSMGFPPTDVRRITPRKLAGGDRLSYLIDVTFMGLYGVSTPLPLHYAVEILRSVEPTSEAASGGEAFTDADSSGTPGSQSEATPVRDFLDLFHHRIISLFYRSWTKYRYDVSFGIPERNVITDYLIRLVGCMPSYSERMLGVEPLRLIRYAGMLTRHPSSAIDLEGILLDFWEDTPIKVEQFSGRWVPLATEDMNRTGMLNSRLGVDLTVGEQVYDLSGAFRISVGPVDWETYMSFLPDGVSHHRMRSLTKLYCHDPLAFTIEVRIRAGEVPETRLSSTEETGRLGFTSWVRTEDVGETSVVFHGSSASPMGRSAESTSPSSRSEVDSRQAGPDERTTDRSAWMGADASVGRYKG